jgi:hypothetical protein
VPIGPVNSFDIVAQCRTINPVPADTRARAGATGLCQLPDA